ncbi:ArpU family phage packaging/lysis transcriptional regulator [Sporosarcina sp. FSL K6-3457]|uniref:ArpU family phage packaging/lysis transcriptional regulator n=1 Tax=Sporosarcina sp. FSL K6-3457 TaxID=2978204 RepID=UPI0030F9CB21
MNNLPEIDRKATRDAVEAVLERYRMYSLQVSLDRLPSITASYSLTPASSNLPSSSTERAAIANVEYEIKREKFIDWIVFAVNQLSEIERSIVYMRYLQKNELFDYQIYIDLNMSERNYYRIKSRLLEKLAFVLKIEAYKEEVHSQ